MARRWGGPLLTGGQLYVRTYMHGIVHVLGSFLLQHAYVVPISSSLGILINGRHEC